MKKFNLILFIASFVGCSPVVGGGFSEEGGAIGVASMNSNRIIKVQIRMDSHGAVGDVSYEVDPSDPRYGIILKRVGGLLPGEEKFIPAESGLGLRPESK